jgi:hypothetical protein
LDDENTCHAGRYHEVSNSTQRDGKLQMVDRIASVIERWMMGHFPI